jgi:hypothetical protein
VDFRDDLAVGLGKAGAASLDGFAQAGFGAFHPVDDELGGALVARDRLVDQRLDRGLQLGDLLRVGRRIGFRQDLGGEIAGAFRPSPRVARCAGRKFSHLQSSIP